MSKFLKDIPIVTPIENHSENKPLLDNRILLRTIERFAENINFTVALGDTFSHRDLGKQIHRAVPAIKDRIFLGSTNGWQRLLQIMDRANKEHVMIIPQNACGMPLASLDLMAKLIHDTEVDLAYSDQVVGLLPFVVSKKFLRKLAASDNNLTPVPSSLRTLNQRDMLLNPMYLVPMKLLGKKWLKNKYSYNGTILTKLHTVRESGNRIQKIEILQGDIGNNPIPYLPQSQRDRALANYLLEKVSVLENILQSIEELPVSEGSKLSEFFREYCDTFAITYPIYRLTGQPEIPEEIRKLTSAPKSVGDCYLRAIHFTKFLKQYTNLRNSSRVLDIGCGWGVLALGLVNLIEDPGSYLGLDIQKEAIDWTQKEIAPLNPRFSFMHLDIANSVYNPEGSIQPEVVHLPAANESADLVILSSVFTHMRRESIEQYLREIRRILSKEGIVAFSYFHSSFFGNNEDYRVRFPDNPDRMTFFSTREMRKLLFASGLSEIRQVNYNGHFNSTDAFFQTFMFATKTP